MAAPTLSLHGSFNGDANLPLPGVVVECIPLRAWRYNDEPEQTPTLVTGTSDVNGNVALTVPNLAAAGIAPRGVQVRVTVEYPWGARRSRSVWLPDEATVDLFDVMAGEVGLVGPAPAGPAGPRGLQGTPGIDHQGAWDVLVAYAADDAVGHLGASYVASVATAAGEEPGVSAKWDLVAAKGDQGVQGIQGVKGDTGAAATADAGTTATGAAGTVAAVANSGTTAAAIFDFTIPRGDKGDKGDQGVKGDVGPRGLTWQGGWAAGVAYAAHDGVAHLSESWIANVATAAGEEPGVSAKWEMLAAKGQDGAGSPATVLSPSVVAAAQAGAVGAATDYARRDHTHPSEGFAADPHTLGGASHSADTLANLNLKISDANLTADHGGLGGLADDDHTQYALADGTRGSFVKGTVRLTVSATEPGTPSADDLWVDTA